MRRTFLLTATLLAIMFFVVMEYRPARTRRSMGLQVKIALPVPCRAGRAPVESVRVLRAGRVAMNSEEMTLDELDRRLKATFRNRVQRVVFLTGGGELQFSEFVEVLAIAAKHADYVSLVTPTVEGTVKAHSGACLDPNIEFSQFLM